MRCSDAKLQPAEIGYVNAHGTSTPIGDVLEAHAIRNFFGERKVPVSSTKSMTGHLLGGAGGLEAGVSVLALRDQILPPTVNLENQDPDTKEWTLFPIMPARRASTTRYRILSASAEPTARWYSSAGRRSTGGSSTYLRRPTANLKAPR